MKSLRNILLKTHKQVLYSCKRFTIKFHIMLILGSEYTSSDLLKNLDEKNRKNLGLSDVYTGNSNNIKIKCIPFYMGIKVKHYALIFPF